MAYIIHNKSLYWRYPTNFGIVGDLAFPTFEEAKKEVIKQLSAELQSAIINQHHLTAEEINSRLNDAREDNNSRR